MFFQPFYLIIAEIFPGFICAVSAVTEDSIVSGQGNGSLGSVVGCIRMLLQELIQQRHAVVSAGHNGSVVLDIFTGRFSVFIQHHLAGNSTAVIRMIVTQVVQRKHVRFLAFRKINFSRGKMHSTVLIDRLIYQIMQGNQHIAVIVHLLSDPVELIHCRHPFAKALCLVIVLEECFLRIYDQ